MQHWDFSHDHSGLGGLGDDTTDTTSQDSSSPSWITSISNAISSLAPAVAQFETAKTTLKTGKVPTAQVNVGTSPQVQQMIMYGGLAVLGLGLMFAMKGGKRR